MPQWRVGRIRPLARDVVRRDSPTTSPLRLTVALAMEMVLALPLALAALLVRILGVAVAVLIAALEAVSESVLLGTLRAVLAGKLSPLVALTPATTVPAALTAVPEAVSETVLLMTLPPVLAGKLSPLVALTPAATVPAARTAVLEAVSEAVLLGTLPPVLAVTLLPLVALKPATAPVVPTGALAALLEAVILATLLHVRGVTLPPLVALTARSPRRAQPKTQTPRRTCWRVQPGAAGAGMAGCWARRPTRAQGKKLVLGTPVPWTTPSPRQRLMISAAPRAPSTATWLRTCAQRDSRRGRAPVAGTLVPPGADARRQAGV